MLPPHCGQTRLIIDEIMLAFDSPGTASMTLMLSSFTVASCKRDAKGKPQRRLLIQQLSTCGSWIVRSADKHLAGDRREAPTRRCLFEDAVLPSPVSV